MYMFQRHVNLHSSPLTNPFWHHIWHLPLWLVLVRFPASVHVLALVLVPVPAPVPTPPSAPAPAPGFEFPGFRSILTGGPASPADCPASPASPGESFCSCSYSCSLSFSCSCCCSCCYSCSCSCSCSLFLHPRYHKWGLSQNQECGYCVLGMYTKRAYSVHGACTLYRV